MKKDSLKNTSKPKAKSSRTDKGNPAPKLTSPKTATPATLKKSVDSEKASKKMDEILLGLPHSGLQQIDKSLESLENFSSDLAEKDGIVGLLGRAVLFRAKAIRQSLRPTKTKGKK